ncbi:hypothetical protein Pfo_018466 [Paulownia fortunei]|nr:hypothetical protein Pfo_018466 [Paulownia fortunei]
MATNLRLKLAISPILAAQSVYFSRAHSRATTVSRGHSHPNLPERLIYKTFPNLQIETKIIIFL